MQCNENTNLNAMAFGLAAAGICLVGLAVYDVFQGNEQVENNSPKVLVSLGVCVVAAAGAIAHLNGSFDGRVCSGWRSRVENQEHAESAAEVQQV